MKNKFDLNVQLIHFSFLIDEVKLVKLSTLHFTFILLLKPVEQKQEADGTQACDGFVKLHC